MACSLRVNRNMERVAAHSHPVSEHDRSYFRRLAEWERQNEGDAKREPAALLLTDRLYRSAHRTDRNPRRTPDDDLDWDYI